MKKVLILGSTNLAVFGLRTELIEKLQQNQYEVIVAFQSGELGDGKEISKKHNCKFYEVTMERRGKNPFKDVQVLKSYLKILRKEKPDIVLSFNVKCNIYGGIACRMTKTAFIPNITGLGKGLAEGKITKKITRLLYKISIKKAECVFFQNDSDKKFFIDNKIKFKKGIVLPGSGVNLERFKVFKYPTEDKLIFLYIARVMKVKGIDEYIEAAKYIRNKYPNTEFQICGYYEEDYKEIVEHNQEAGIIKYNGLVSNVQDYVKKSNCIILPSYHPEGIANVLLEAAACGRPVITTNRSGCKETLIENKTGFLIEERNSKSLIKAIEKFIKLDKKDQEKMGLEGRKYIEEKFDRNIVVTEYMNIIEKIGEKK